MKLTTNTEENRERLNESHILKHNSKLRKKENLFLKGCENLSKRVISLFGDDICGTLKLRGANQFGRNKSSKINGIFILGL